MIHPLFAVLPGSIDDPAAPSGGNRYDREVLRHLGLDPARESLIPGSWPRPGPAARRALTEALRAVPDGAVVLIDGLVACGVPDLLEPHATRLRIAVLVHLPLSDETGLPAAEAAELRAREARTLRLAAAVIATSTPAARRVEELHAVTGVHAIPPGVDPAPPAAPSAAGHRLLNVASLTHRKGHDLLLTALRHLSADLAWTCTVAGAGHLPNSTITPPATLTLTPAPAPSPASRTAARSWSPDHLPVWRINQDPQLLAGEGLRSVRFVGAVGGDVLDDVYANADLFVLPSRAETYGMVVTEALARGLPVIAADVGGVPEALGAATGGGIPGRLIPPDDPEALAAALHDWLTDAGLRERWRGDAGARRAELTGWDETARLLREVLDGLAGPREH